jgi:hypothetical protein
MANRIVKGLAGKALPIATALKTGMDYYNSGAKAVQNTQQFYKDAVFIDNKMITNPEFSQRLNNSVDQGLKRQIDIEKLSFGTGGKIRTRRHHKKSKRVKRKGASRRKRRY